MMLLPLYVHPVEDPAAWMTAATLPDTTVIVNVHNGPGTSFEPLYGSVTARLAAAGVPMLGYVDLHYGTRHDGDVECDITGWGRYPVEGVFFDRTPSGVGGLAATARATGAVRGTVALNPGVRPHAGYAPLASVICTYEGPWSGWAEGDLPAGPDWPNAAHLVYGVPADRLDEAAALLASRVPHGLVTDRTEPQPYLGLPSVLAGAR